MSPKRGEIWWVELDGTKGHEQSGRRPAFILSPDAFNAGPGGLVILIPMTRTDRGLPVHIRVDPPDAGLADVSFIMCEQMRSASRTRLRARIGHLSDATVKRVEQVVRGLICL